MQAKSMLAMLMGVIIIIADLYWTYTSYTDPTWLALGVIIFIAAVIWIVLDWSLSRAPMPMKPA
jgi:type IV secretory pathway TrbL component